MFDKVVCILTDVHSFPWNLQKKIMKMLSVWI